MFDYVSAYICTMDIQHNNLACKQDYPILQI